MTHSEMDEVYELYLLGALDSEEASEITRHLDRKCSYCLAGIEHSSQLVAGLSQMVEMIPPPATLRERILAVAAIPKPHQRSGWPFAFAAACAAAIALAIWGVGERDRLTEITRQRNELRSALAILSEADTRTVSFGRAPSEPQGRVFVSRTGGVVFVGNHLPQLAAGKTFEFWLVPAKGKPEAAGLFATNERGISVNVLAEAIEPADFAAVAVSVEPQGGSSQPSTKPILIVPLA
jgi:anti-sigma-K factor RskA